MSHGGSGNSDAESSSWPRFIPVSFDTEDLERYEPGGFHPVQLGDVYDNGRYKIVHKLGAGGFSTVWLAYDKLDKNLVSLKVVVANQSASVEAKYRLMDRVRNTERASLIVHRSFTIEGPNGHHLCLVLPLLGPSTSQLSSGFTSRIEPSLSRRISYQVTKALAALHAQGVCHGDVTTANILFRLSEADRLAERDVYRLFGMPKQELLETYDGDVPGPSAPKYIVKPLDFLSSNQNLVSQNIELVDFDQSFPISSPPESMLGIPVEFLAPEVAVGQKASYASDVWALGCSIFRLRSGEGPFSGYEVTSPADLLRVVAQTAGRMPSEWEDTLFDIDGQPTKDPVRGNALEAREGERPLRDQVYMIWDQPDNGVVKTGETRPEHKSWIESELKPYPPCFSSMFWKPTATRIDNVYLHGYNDDTAALLEALPKIPGDEAALLHDLLSKIFIYDPSSRISAAEMLSHPWFRVGHGTP